MYGPELSGASLAKTGTTDETPSASCDRQPLNPHGNLAGDPTVALHRGGGELGMCFSLEGAEHDEVWGPW